MVRSSLFAGFTIICRSLPRLWECIRARRRGKSMSLIGSGCWIGRRVGRKLRSSPRHRWPRNSFDLTLGCRGYSEWIAPIALIDPDRSHAVPEKPDPVTNCDAPLLGEHLGPSRDRGFPWLVFVFSSFVCCR